MSCTILTRIRAHEVSSALAQCPPVLGVTIYAPGTGGHNQWTVEATLSTSVVTSTVLRVLTAWNVGLVDASIQGENMVVSVTV